MDYSIFRLEIRMILFVIALLIYILCCIRKRKFRFAIFLKKKIIVEQYRYTGRNDIKLLRSIYIISLVMAILTLVYIKDFFYDIPYIISKQYCFVRGYTTEQSHGGADISSERRGIFIKDEDTGKVFEITVFSKYVDKNEYLEVQFLPHTKFGAIR